MTKRRRPDEPWTAPPAWTASMPEVSGNEINGRGETRRRRPTQVFWHRRPAEEPFAHVQRSMHGHYTQFPPR